MNSTLIPHKVSLKQNMPYLAFTLYPNVLHVLLSQSARSQLGLGKYHDISNRDSFIGQGITSTAIKISG